MIKEESVSRQLMETLLGAWLDVTVMEEDGCLINDVVFCAKVLEEGIGVMSSNPERIKKAAIVSIKPHDFGKINNSIFSFFDDLLRVYTNMYKDKQDYENDIILFTCFNLLVDENLYGDDNKAILDYVVNTAFPRMFDSKCISEEYKEALKAFQTNLYGELCKQVYAA